MGFSFTVVANVCEGAGDCVEECPVACIHWAGDRRNARGTRFVYIDASECINCAACLSVCPVADAVLDEWEPARQAGVARAKMYRRFNPAWRTEAVLAEAEALRRERSHDAAVRLGDALRSAGCHDLRLLHHLRSDPADAVVWVADLLLDPDGETPP